MSLWVFQMQLKRPGLYITFEGMDGCGKSVQSRKLVDYLRLQYPEREIIYTREPGGTFVGSRIREVLKIGKMEALTTLFLFLADRNQNHHEVIQPALDRGATVVSDRGYWSSIAYQVYGFRIPSKIVLDLHYLLADQFERPQNFFPDMVVYVDTPIEECRRRILERGGFDWYESQPEAFWYCLYEGYDYLIDEGSCRSLRVDGSGSVEQIHQQVIHLLSGVVDLAA